MSRPSLAGVIDSIPAPLLGIPCALAIVFVVFWTAGRIVETTAPAPTPTVTVTAPPVTLPPRTVYVERADRNVKRTPPPLEKSARKSSAPTKGEAQRYARSLVSAAAWPCLRELWTRESGWRTTATSPSGRHHGIPQIESESLRGKGYRYQVDRGLSYIAHRYGGSPCRALAFHDKNGWY